MLAHLLTMLVNRMLMSLAQHLPRRCAASNLEILLPGTSLVGSHSSIRQYRGSNKDKLRKAAREKERLEKELELKYGISSHVQFDTNAWQKKTYDKELRVFKVRLSLPFIDDSVLRSAFIHSSFAEELQLCSRQDSESDEILSIRFSLHDKASTTFSSAALALIGYSSSIAHIKNQLYKKYPNLSPCLCSDLCNFLINRSTVNDIAKNLGITDMILVSKELEDVDDMNHESHLGFAREDIVSDTFFAVVGALCVECGSKEANKFIEDFLLALIDYEDLSTHVTIKDAAKELVQILELNGVRCKPVPRVIVQGGMNSHHPFILVGIFCNDILIGEGASYSMARAREDAFKNAVFKCLEQEVGFERLQEPDSYIHDKSMRS